MKLLIKSIDVYYRTRLGELASFLKWWIHYESTKAKGIELIYLPSMWHEDNIFQSLFVVLLKQLYRHWLVTKIFMIIYFLKLSKFLKNSDKWRLRASQIFRRVPIVILYSLSKILRTVFSSILWLRAKSLLDFEKEIHSESCRLMS